MQFICIILLLLLMINFIECRGPHHPRGEPVAKHHVHYRPTRGDPNDKVSLDQELLHDKEHIQEHMEQEHVEPDLSNLTDEELEFYYFQVHDTDRNSKLDGLEILQAIFHTSNHVNNDNNDDGVSLTDNNDDFDYYVELIDKVLEEDDKNNDGYLSYVEYVEGRRRNRDDDDNNKEPIIKMIT